MHALHPSRSLFLLHSVAHTPPITPPPYRLPLLFRAREGSCDHRHRSHHHATHTASTPHLMHGLSNNTLYIRFSPFLCRRGSCGGDLIILAFYVFRNCFLLLRSAPRLVHRGVQLKSARGCKIWVYLGMRALSARENFCPPPPSIFLPILW